MNTAVATTRPAPVIRKPIRVMVVDDAIVVRRQLTRWIGDEKDMMVAACLRTGREAVEQLEACNPDVVVLDVDMPELGMGSGGASGAAEIAATGGSVIAQDEETSVVWGMPRAVALAGLCSAVLPLWQIPAEVNRLFGGAARDAA
jgi:chemotaxis response regulator CheB